MNKRELHPEIFQVQNFFSEKECISFINKGEEVSFEEAKVAVDGKQVMIKGIRNNKRIIFKDETLAQNIFSRIQPYALAQFKEHAIVGVNEMFRIYKYEVGQRFKMHRDGSFKRNEKECSFFSLLIYLNDDFEGGETNFQMGITIQPNMGDALCFHHPLRHEGKPILSGEKYVLRTDIMYKLEE